MVIGNIAFLERHGSRRHLKDRNTEGIDVCSVINVLPQRLLGAHIVRRASNDGRMVACLFDDLGQTEVHQLGLLVSSPHRICGLNVAMNDLLFMSVCEGFAHLHKHMQNARRRNRPATTKNFFQRSAFNVFHRDVEATGLFARIVDRHDIRVIELRGGLRFTHEVIDRLRILGQRLRKNFEGDDSVKQGVLNLVDDAHAAAAKFTNDLIAVVFRTLIRCAFGAPPIASACRARKRFILAGNHAYFSKPLFDVAKVIVESHDLLENFDGFASVPIILVDRGELVVALYGFAGEFAVTNRLLQRGNCDGQLTSRSKDVSEDRRSAREVSIFLRDLLEDRNHIFIAAFGMIDLACPHKISGLVE